MKKASALIVVIILLLSFALTACPAPHTHDWGEYTTSVEPTCGTEGKQTRVCKLNAKHTQTKPIAKIPHDFGDWTLTKEPTDTVAGTRTKICKDNALHTYSEDIPAAVNTDNTNVYLESTRAIFRLQANERFEAYAGGWVYVSAPASSASLDRTLYRMLPDGSLRQQMPFYFKFESYRYQDGWLYVNDGTAVIRMRPDGTNSLFLANEAVSHFEIFGEWMYYRVSATAILMRVRIDSSSRQFVENDCFSFIVAEGSLYMSYGTGPQWLMRLNLDGSKLTLTSAVGNITPRLLHEGMLYFTVSTLDGKGDKLGKVNITTTDESYLLTLADGRSLQNIYIYQDSIFFNQTFTQDGYVQTIICWRHLDKRDVTQIASYRALNYSFVEQNYFMSPYNNVYAEYSESGDIILNMRSPFGSNSSQINHKTHYQGFFVHNKKLFVATTMFDGNDCQLLQLTGNVYYYGYLDGWVYVMSGIVHYKMQPDGSQKQSITYAELNSVLSWGETIDDWVYHVENTVEIIEDNIFTELHLMRTKLDETQTEILATNIGTYSDVHNGKGFTLYNGWLYFPRESNDTFSLQRIDIDGKEEQQVIDSFDSYYIHSDYIFITETSGTATRLVRYNLDGSKRKVLLERQSTGIDIETVEDGFLYYVDKQQKNTLCRVSIEGGSDSVVVTDRVSFATTVFYDGWIYYLHRYYDDAEVTQQTAIYKVRPDGTNLTVVNQSIAPASAQVSSICTSFSISDGIIHYSIYNYIGIQYWTMSLDGEPTLFYDDYGVEKAYGTFMHNGRHYVIVN